MSENINFFNAALKLLRVGNSESNDIGTTADEFAENYSNASGAEKGSSVWNEYFEQGKEEYKIINTDGKDGITQEEYNIKDKIKNIPKKPSLEINYTSFKRGQPSHCSNN